jgi:hypothetical protein
MSTTPYCYIYINILYLAVHHTRLALRATRKQCGVKGKNHVDEVGDVLIADYEMDAAAEGATSPYADAIKLVVSSVNST